MVNAQLVVQLEKTHECSDKVVTRGIVLGEFNVHSKLATTHLRQGFSLSHLESEVLHASGSSLSFSAF